MMSPDRILVYVLLVYVFFHTASYGAWTWRRKNRLGAAAIFILALAVLLFPVVVLYLRM